MRLFLVRHGESVWNVEKRLQGQSPGVPLTDRGREQALAAARELGERITRPYLWTSDLLRARQTASIIAGELELVVREDERLREQGYGVLEGRLTSELRAEPVPEGLDITEVAWGGGESIRDVYKRVRDLLLEMRGEDDDVVLVTHGDALRVALTAIDQLNAGEPDDRPWRSVAWDVVGNGEVVERELPLSAATLRLRWPST